LANEEITLARQPPHGYRNLLCRNPRRPLRLTIELGDQRAAHVIFYEKQDFRIAASAKMSTRLVAIAHRQSRHANGEMSHTQGRS
jgi:hypothetical protein